MFVPTIIPNSPLSMVSTPSNLGYGGSASRFSHFSHTTHAHSLPQIFATTTWKPKEPPCFFGRSMEDIHAWTSLVHHYLAFIVGSAAQQVTYLVIPLCEFAQRWYIGYERRHHGLPEGWSQLCNALLKQFGSNIQSQEAQSTLTTIRRGNGWSTTTLATSKPFWVD